MWVYIVKSRERDLLLILFILFSFYPIFLSHSLTPFSCYSFTQGKVVALKLKLYSTTQQEHRPLISLLYTVWNNRKSSVEERSRHDILFILQWPTCLPVCLPISIEEMSSWGLRGFTDLFYKYTEFGEEEKKVKENEMVRGYIDGGGNLKKVPNQYSFSL